MLSKAKQWSRHSVEVDEAGATPAGSVKRLRIANFGLRIGFQSQIRNPK